MRGEGSICAVFLSAVHTPLHLVRLSHIFMRGLPGHGCVSDGVFTRLAPSGRKPYKNQKEQRRVMLSPLVPSPATSQRGVRTFFVSWEIIEMVCMSYLILWFRY